MFVRLEAVVRVVSGDRGYLGVVQFDDRGADEGDCVQSISLSNITVIIRPLAQ